MTVDAEWGSPIVADTVGGDLVSRTGDRDDAAEMIVCLPITLIVVNVDTPISL
jgi:hypothetical protein